MLKKFYILLFLILCLQTKAQNNDTIPKKNPIENNREPQKNKFIKSIEKLLYKKPNQKPSNQKEIKKNESINYSSFEGKIIRNINIETMDPFGNSIDDSTQIAQKRFEKLGNKAHLKTKKFTIRNILLFKPDQKLDSVKIKESERLMRTQRYIRRVKITPVLIPNSPDSVDIDIKVLDSWSIYPTGSLSNSSGRIRLVSRNFGGFGHYLSTQYKTNFVQNKHAFNAQYQVNNIKNTFINVGGLYDIDFAKNHQKSVYIQRPFYSPLTKYAGGATLSKIFYKDSIPDITNNNQITNIKYNIYDVWFGRAFRISKTNDKNITNLITTLRYNVVNYKENPIPTNDPEGVYSDQQFVLGSVAISSSQYKQTKYLFNYGLIEDVNYGKNFSITGGLQWKNQILRPYLGAEFSLGKFVNDNYLGINVEWGTFFNANKPEQSVLSVKGMFFSRIYEYRNWKFRQFFNPELVFGYNRLDYTKDRINLNGADNGIDGFYSYNLFGTKRVLLSFQTQSYAPGSLLGFRFSPFLSASFGWLGDEGNKFVSDNMYSKIAFGISLNNDYLVFQNIQISIALYPTIPGNGRNIIKTNNIRNDNIDLMRFNSGSPTTVPFQ